MKKLFLVLICCLTVSSCTANQRAKSFGGTAKYDLSPGEQLVNLTWKDEHLWILTKPMEDGHSPETYKFEERSSFGIMQGTVILTEHK